MRRAFLVVMLLLSPAAARADAPDQISMRTSSWRRPLSAWTLNADGSGEISSGDAATTRRLPPAPGRYDQVAKILEVIIRYETKPLPCRPVMTDLPYGEVDWRRSGVTHRFSFNYSCAGTAQADKVYDALEAAQSVLDQGPAAMQPQT